MITPSFLKSGDKIGIVAPARKVIPEEMENAYGVFRDWGLEVVEDQNLYEVHHQYAGTDEQRIDGLQRMLDDENIKAILCARGGYGTVRIIDRIDFRKFVKNPKWVVGFSDITVLHSHIQSNFGIETLHAVMPYSFFHQELTKECVDSLKKALFGQNLAYQYENDFPYRPGIAKGILVGGNLSMLYALDGTASDLNTDGKVLFIEDLDEYLYHFDRMMLKMKRGGKLDRLAGLIVGGITDMHDNSIAFGKTAYEIVQDAVSAYDYPVCFGFPAGHIADNRALILGRDVDLVVGENVSLTF
ncbi:MAG: LD-carboxypeptidase [Bacteroidota bacterium]